MRFFLKMNKIIEIGLYQRTNGCQKTRTAGAKIDLYSSSKHGRDHRFLRTKTVRAPYLLFHGWDRIGVYCGVRSCGWLHRQYDWIFCDAILS